MAERDNISGSGGDNLDSFSRLEEAARQGEVDWNDVCLSELAQELAQSLEEGRVDMETAAERKGLLLKLMEQKALWLLPSTRISTQEDEEELPQDYREVMLARLMEYRSVRQAAAQLEDLARTHEDRFTRLPPEIRKWEESLRPLEGIGLEDLVDALSHILEGAEEEAASETLEREEFPLEQVMAGLDKHLEALGKEVEFSAIFPRGSTRPHIVATFLALLELIRTGRAQLRKDGEKETIFVRHKEHDPGS